MQFDLVIKGGTVVSPGCRSGKLDVAIEGNRIAAIESSFPPDAAARVVDAGGLIVTPGLVDLHTHVYHNATYWGIVADPVAARTGVTTWLDVGSAGAYNFGGFRRWIVEPSHARIFALLNISSIGLAAPTWELANLNYCDVDMCCRIVDVSRDLILGIKCRMDANTTGGSMEPLRRARSAADNCGLPLMVHVGIGPPTIEQVLDLMRPGDILTHCFTGHNMRIVDERGLLLECAKRARDTGVVFDIGHGAGSFSFDTARALIGNGYLPDVISSDIHQLSVNGPLFDLPTCLSKFLALGMSLEDVVRAATVRPASVMRMEHEIGSIRVGALADIALFRLVEGKFSFYDVFMQRLDGKQLLVNQLTICDGREMVSMPDGARAPWIELSADQRNLAEWGHTPESMGRSKST